MNIEHLERAFARIGARVKLGREPRDTLTPLALDVARDRRGEFFEIRLAEGFDPEVVVMNTAPADRHLLLMVRGVEAAARARTPRWMWGQPAESRPRRGKDLHKYLCGFDERSWFAAAVPESSGASTVREAKEALKPPAARAAQDRLGVKPRRRQRRKNAAFVRQGEWFFIPRPDFEPGARPVLRDEPLSRGQGKAHVVQFACRMGGERVYASRQHPQGLLPREYQELIRSDPAAAKLNWETWLRDAELFAKGTVRHPDHKTVELAVWHRVLPNTESQAAARSYLVFLD